MRRPQSYRQWTSKQWARFQKTQSAAQAQHLEAAKLKAQRSKWAARIDTIAETAGLILVGSAAGLVLIGFVVFVLTKLYELLHP